MKTNLLIITILFLSFNSLGQSVNSIPISEIQSKHIEIVGTQKLMSKKVTIQIDFGQNVKMNSGLKQLIVKDENGNKKEFNSMIDALNFFSNYGYEFKQAYTVTISNQNVYHYILNKIEHE